MKNQHQQPKIKQIHRPVVCKLLATNNWFFFQIQDVNMKPRSPTKDQTQVPLFHTNFAYSVPWDSSWIIPIRNLQSLHILETITDQLHRKPRHLFRTRANSTENLNSRRKECQMSYRVVCHQQFNSWRVEPENRLLRRVEQIPDPL